MENHESYNRVEDNVLSRSRISEDRKKSIKIEIDTFDDYVWESTIESSRENIVNDYVEHSAIEESKDVDVDKQNNVELPFESQNVTVNNINDFNDVLKNHLAEDKIQLNLKSNKCKYCEKRFKLKFGLNRHIQKHHKYNEIQGNIKNIKREDCSNANANDRNTSYEMLNSQSAVSVALHDSKTQYWPNLNIKEEKYMSTNDIETNNSDQINLPNNNESMILTGSHNLIVEDWNVLNIKQGKTKQSSVQMDLFNDNEASYSDINGLNNSPSIIQKKYFYCDPCERIFPSLVTFEAHQALHDKPQSFSREYYDRTFSGQGQCTNHEKSHITQKKNKSTNARGKGSSDQIHLMNSNATVISTASNNSVANDFDIQRKKKIKQEEYSNANAQDRNTSYEMLNSQSAVSVVLHDSKTQYWPNLNIKEEKYMSTNDIETNNSDQINLPNSNESMILTGSHNLIVEDWNVLNIKQGKTTQSSVQMDLFNDNEASYSDINGLNNSPSIIQKKYFYCDPCERIFPSLVTFEAHQALHDKPQSFSREYYDRTFSGKGQCTNHEKSHITQKKNKSTNARGKGSSDQIHLMNSNATVISTASNNSVANDFDIQRKKKIKQEEYSNANAQDRNTSYEMLNSQSAVSVALHDSKTQYWPNLNIKEEKYMSTNDIETNNSDQINLPNSNESMILTGSHNLIVEDWNVLNIKQGKTTQSSVQMDLFNDNEASYSDINGLNNSPSIIQKKYFYCDPCERIFPSLVTFEAHQALHDKPQSFSREYYDRTFSGQGQCTNHEKSHITQKKNKSTNARGKGSSDQIHLMNSNATVISTASNNSVANDFDIQRKKKIKQEEYSNANAQDRNTSYEMLNSQSAVSVALHDSKTQYWPNLNIKKEKYMSTNDIETNNSDQINLPNSNESMILTGSHNLIVEDWNVLNIKQENKCNKKKSRSCIICNENFAEIGALTNHLNIHMDRKPFQCQYCYQQFSREGPYILHKKKHVLINDDQKPMIEFTSNQDSKDFIKSLRYKCNYCEKTYSSLSYRLTHMKKFHIESDTTGSFMIAYKKPRKPKKSVQCKVCFKTLSSGYLSKHMRVHSGDKPYTCVKCNRDFRFVSSFTMHMRKKCALYYPK